MWDSSEMLTLFHWNCVSLWCLLAQASLARRCAGVRTIPLQGLRDSEVLNLLYAVSVDPLALQLWGRSRYSCLAVIFLFLSMCMVMLRSSAGVNWWNLVMPSLTADSGAMFCHVLHHPGFLRGDELFRGFFCFTLFAVAVD